MQRVCVPDHKLDVKAVPPIESTTIQHAAVKLAPDEKRRAPAPMLHHRCARSRRFLPWHAVATAYINNTHFRCKYYKDNVYALCEKIDAPHIPPGSGCNACRLITGMFGRCPRIPSPYAALQCLPRTVIPNHRGRGEGETRQCH